MRNQDVIFPAVTVIFLLILTGSALFPAHISVATALSNPLNLQTHKNTIPLQKRKMVGESTSTQVLRDLEISLRTNHIE